MSYYLEIWLRGFAKDQLRELSNQDSGSYHPHVTIVRPFDIVSSEGVVRDKIVDYCRGFSPMHFSLEGIGDFGGKFYHVPVFEDGRLMRFDNGLEDCISEDVEFVRKKDKVKKFHVTVNEDEGGFHYSGSDHHMLRLTAIRDKEIWFEQDLVTGKTLDRVQALDRYKWNDTRIEFGGKI